MHRKKSGKPKSPLLAEIKNTQFKIRLNESRYRAEQDELNALLTESQNALSKVQKNIEDLKISVQYASESKDQPLRSAFEGFESRFKEFENKNASQIVEALDQRVFEQSKTLDLLHHEKREKEKILNDKIHEYKIIISSHTQGPNQQILNRLRDDYQKISMKTEETRRLNEKYKAIYQALLDEKPLYEKRIETAEAEIEMQKCEAISLRVIHREAEKSRGSAETELRTLKKIAEEAKLRRQKEIAPLSERKRDKPAQQRRDKEEKVSNLNNDIHFSGSTSVVEAMESNYIAAFEKLKNATGKTTTKEIEEHLLNQHQIRKQLEEKAKDMETKLEELTKLKDSFEDELERRVLSTETSKDISDIEKEIELKENQMKELQQEIFSYKSRLSYVSPLLIDIRSVVENIYNTLNLEDDSDRLVNGISTLEIINHCQEKLERRMKEIADNQLTLEFQLDEVDEEDEDLGYSTSNSVVPPRRPMKDYSSDESEEDKLVSRDLLKKQALVLAEKKSKQKSTKRQLLKL